MRFESFHCDFVAGSAPTWIWVLVGASVVFYANLDCIDGKQARRTQSSSPLGQLFDHGCDAYIVHLLVGVMVSCFNITCGWQAANGVLWVKLNSSSLIERSKVDYVSLDFGTTRRISYGNDGLWKRGLRCIRSALCNDFYMLGTCTYRRFDLGCTNYLLVTGVERW